jgi:hypothetical protein
LYSVNQVHNSPTFFNDKCFFWKTLQIHQLILIVVYFYPPCWHVHTISDIQTRFYGDHHAFWQRKIFTNTTDVMDVHTKMVPDVVRTQFSHQL